MRFASDLCKEGRDIRQLMVNHFLKHRGIAAECNGREVDHQVTLDNRFGDLPVFIIDIANARITDPAEKITCTIADLLFPQENMLHLPALAFKFPGQGGMYTMTSRIVGGGTVEDECFHGLFL